MPATVAIVTASLRIMYLLLLDFLVHFLPGTIRFTFVAVSLRKINEGMPSRAYS